MTRAGSRKKQYGVNYQLTENRYAWVTVEGGKYLILVGEDTGSGSDVILFNPRPGTLPDLSINLSNLTEAELDAVEGLFKTAFEWARPIVQRRDKEAQDAWDNGDDSFARVYRAVPTVVYRKRPGIQHSEGVHNRSEGVPEGGESRRDGDAGGVRGTGDGLVEPDQSDSQSEDDRPEAD